MIQHTPGPWGVFPAGDTMKHTYSQPFAIGQVGQPNLIAGVFGDVRGGMVVADKNADLIAAGPELLAAANQALGFYDALSGPHHEGEAAILDCLKAAIAKAEGR